MGAPLKLQAENCFCSKFHCIPAHASTFSQRLTDVEIFNQARNFGTPQQPLKYTEAVSLNQPARVYGVPDRVKREASCPPCQKLECIAIPLRYSQSLAYTQPQSFYGVPAYNGRLQG